MDYTKINGAEVKLLRCCFNEPAPLQVFIEATEMNRTEVYDRLNMLIYKQLLSKKKMKFGSTEISVYCITDDGISTIEKIDREQTKL